MVQRMQVDNPYGLTHEKSSEMNLANMLAKTETTFPNDLRSSTKPINPKGWDDCRKAQTSAMGWASV